MIAESIESVKPRCALVGAKQWFICPDVDRDIRPTEFNRIECVARRLLNSHIAGNRCNRGHANFGRSERHDKSDGIIGCNVGVDEEGARHPRSIPKQMLRKGFGADCG